MNFIPPIQNIFLFSKDLPINFLKFIHIVSDNAKKISDFVIHYFKLLQNVGLMGFAAKAILVDYLPLSGNSEDNDLFQSNTPLYETTAEIHFNNIKNIKIRQGLSQGILFGTSGITSIIAALAELNLFSIGEALPIISWGGWGLFLFGCLYSLERNIRIYLEADEMEKAAIGEEEQVAQRIKLSAIFGMMSDISYILLTIFSVIGVPAPLYIVLAIFAIFSITLKIIYDYFYLQMPETI